MTYFPSVWSALSSTEPTVHYTYNSISLLGSSLRAITINHNNYLIWVVFQLNTYTSQSYWFTLSMQTVIKRDRKGETIRSKLLHLRTSTLFLSNQNVSYQIFSSVSLTVSRSFQLEHLWFVWKVQPSQYQKKSKTRTIRRRKSRAASTK